MKPYKYRLAPRPPKMPLNRPKREGEAEPLTGFVHGKEASDLEERFANALDKAGKKYVFEYEVLTDIGVPGEENQIDFVVEEIYPVEIDGGFTHKTGSQKAKDQTRDAILNEYLSRFGWNPIDRIPGDDIETPEAADQVVAERF